MKPGKTNKGAEPEPPRRSRRQILREYWHHAHGSRWLLIAMSAAMLVDGVLQAALVNYLKVVVDRLVVDPAGFVRDELARMVMLGILAGVVFFPVAYFGHLALSVLSSRLVVTFRMHLYRHLQKLSMSFYHENRSGDITARLTSDVDGGVQGVISALNMCVWALAVSVTSLVSMLWLSWRLTLIFVALNVTYYAVWHLYRKRVGALARRVRDQAGEVNAFATEGVSSVVLMKAFAREEDFFSRFSDVQNRLYQTQVEAARTSLAFSDILQTIGKFLAPVAILGAGAILVERGLTVGTLIAFWSYWTVVQSPISLLFNTGPTFASAMASMDRIHDFLEQAPSPADRVGARHFRPREGKIEFRNLTFAYPGRKDKPVFRGMNLVVPPHSSLGIVGSSGAGKSTLVQLVLRFYDPDSGSIHFDDVDLRDMTQESLRRSTGVVLQESLLLSGTIRDNIRIGDETANDARIWTALEQAGADEFVRATGAGLDAEVGERGVALSGGQRQRLCIARVFLRNPPLVVFDEATSALDTATEAQIQQSMRLLLKGRTSILIAHRLSTIVACDRILMLKDGVVLGLAPHGELLTTCAEYADLVSKQDLRTAVDS